METDLQRQVDMVGTEVFPQEYTLVDVDERPRRGGVL